MMTDRGFSHMLANIILEKDPTNETALKMLQQPKNRAVVNGVTYDLDKVSEEVVTETWAKDVMSRMIPIASRQTDELRAAYETPNMSIVQSAQPARAFVTRPQGRFEVIVRDTFTHEGVLMARVVPVDDVNMYGVDLTYEIPASLIETEAGCLES